MLLKSATLLTLIAGDECSLVFLASLAVEGKLWFTPQINFSISGIIKLWNITSGKDFKTFYLHTVDVVYVAFSPDGNTIASVGRDEDVLLVDVLGKPDFDNDGMLDGWEMDSGLDPSDFRNKFSDGDDDGLMNSLEWFLGTDAGDNDTDNDGMPDGWEYLGGTKSLVDDATTDFDGDGISNVYEYLTEYFP
ncbi:MAG: WD40 repeat domain-containing protein [Candidatus Hodarchaeales archaeon]|jgi:WD40 repeat protein